MFACRRLLTALKQQGTSVTRSQISASPAFSPVFSAFRGFASHSGAHGHGAGSHAHGGAHGHNSHDHHHHEEDDGDHQRLFGQIPHEGKKTYSLWQIFLVPLTILSITTAFNNSTATEKTEIEVEHVEFILPDGRSTKQWRPIGVAKPDNELINHHKIYEPPRRLKERDIHVLNFIEAHDPQYLASALKNAKHPEAAAQPGDDE